jgi:chromosomal replication initiator protein
MDTLWENVLSLIKTRMNPSSFTTWFAPTKQIGIQANILWVAVPNQYFVNWLEEHYRDVILEILTTLTGTPTAIRFVINEQLEHADAPIIRNGAPPSSAPSSAESPIPEPEPMLRPPPHAAAAPASAGGVERDDGLNPKYTFDTYVVGNSNQMAHAASKAIAQQLSITYNPLFIYGGVGLGKTHLMHAIGHEMRKNQPAGFRLCYLTSERFMNDLINAIRYETRQEFRDNYRNIDLLLIDDIQFIAGKEQTQEELFHTFNTLYHAQKQLILSSDCPPKKIPTLEERLRSRFEWGLIVDIQPPDLETKIVILKKKAETEGIDLPDDVAMFIATKITSNIRTLEGCLAKLAAHAILTHEQITVELTKRVLHDILDPDNSAAKPAITIERIQHVVAAHYGLKPDDMKAATRLRTIAFPRQIAMYLARKLTAQSLPTIGQFFGGKDHTTIMYACQKIEELQQSDSNLRDDLSTLEKTLLT